MLPMQPRLHAVQDWQALALVVRVMLPVDVMTDRTPTTESERAALAARSEPPNDAKRAAFVMAVNAIPAMSDEGHAHGIDYDVEYKWLVHTEEEGASAIVARDVPAWFGVRVVAALDYMAAALAARSEPPTLIHEGYAEPGTYAVNARATPPAPALDDEDINARRFTRWFLMQDRGKQADWIRSVYPKLDDLLGILAPERQDG